MSTTRTTDRWRSTDASRTGRALVRGGVSKTLLGGFDPHSACQQTERQTGAIRDQFPLSR